MRWLSYSDSKFCCWKGDFLPDMQRLFKKNQRSQRQHLVLLDESQRIKQALKARLATALLGASACSF